MHKHARLSPKGRETMLARLQAGQHQAGVEEALVKSAHKAETLKLNQYKAGTVPYGSVITAQATTLSSEQAALTVLRGRPTGSVALIANLGGDWHSLPVAAPR